MTKRNWLIPAVTLGFAASFASPLAAGNNLPAGIWTNTEDVYFAEEEGRERADWIGIEVREDNQWRTIDAFKAPLSDWSDTDIPNLSRIAENGWRIGQSELRRARDFYCWVSIRKHAPKSNGNEDWTFQRNIHNFDQGGRILVPGNNEAPDVTIRLRNVTWAKGSRNKPALVLYVHKEDPVRAVSYSWASPGSTMVGVNLRWIQVSCSRSASETKGPGEPMDVDRNAKLADAGEKWRQTYQAGDWDALRTLYADDAVLMTQGSEKLIGADSIVSFLQRLPNAGANAEFQFENEEVITRGDLGFVTAKYRMIITFPGVTQKTIVAGRSFLVYQWVDGEWLLWRDIDNLAPDATSKDFQ